jgi:hypothetical protein
VAESSLFPPCHLYRGRRHHATVDILNMCLSAAPMIGLYGISIGVAWLAGARRERARVSWP